MAESWLASGIIYGPVASRRFGRSLGINLLPPGVKVCGFNCNYCELGWTFDLADDAALAKHRFPEAEEAAEALEAALAGRPALDAVTISGNGEPTLHPDLWRVVTALIEVRDRSATGLPVHVLTNGAMLGSAQVVSALNLVEGRHVKIDAGSESMFLEMNSPTFDIGLYDVMRHLPKLTDFTVQAMFTRGRRDNTVDAEVDKWIEVVGKVRPVEAHLVSLDRPPADGAIRAVEAPVLQSIAQRLTARTGIPARIF